MASSTTVDGGLPAGTTRFAVGLAGTTAAILRRWGARVVADPLAVVANLRLPQVVGECSPPAAPVPVGGGAVHADVLDDDRPLFDALRRRHDDPEALARAAQECRLPVTPYRAGPSRDRRRAGPCDPSGAPEVGRGIGPEPDPEPDPQRDPQPGPCPARPLAGVRVVDLSAMWAGPCATAQLAALGADVVRVEPTCRPDGLRGSPATFSHLAAGKRTEPLDLREEPDRRRFERLVSTSRVVVESFSWRVMTNLGYPPEALRALRPDLVLVRIRAFEHGSPEATWVSYGGGVHAASGLGRDGAGPPTPAALAYLDPLTGLVALNGVLTALGGHTSVVDVSLAGTARSLVRCGAGAVSGSRVPAALLRDATDHLGRAGLGIVRAGAAS